MTYTTYPYADVIEIIIRDCSGKKFEKFRINGRDAKKFSEVLYILKGKYGFFPDPNAANLKYDDLFTDEKIFDI